MSSDVPDKQEGRRASAVPLFRPGQTAALRPVTLDLLTGREIFSAPLSPLAVNPARVWESLNPIRLDAERLAGNGLFLNPADNPAASAFDILRSRLLQAMKERGWSRIAVTSPTHGCGKTFVAANLAFSLARRPSSRTVLMDLDLRRPSLFALLAQREAPALREVLSGEQPIESQMRRLGTTLAIGMNGEAVEDAADLLHDPDTAMALDAIRTQLDPEVMIHDMPPALVADDVLALAPNVDAVLLVTDGTRTTPEEIRACERMFDNRIPLMGVVLNRAQDRAAGRYHYGRD